MAISEQQRQKKLAKKKQKRSAVTVNKVTMSMTKAKPYANYPLHECLIPTDLFDSGLGELLVTRRTPTGEIAMSSFVIDVFCLGVKDAMFIVMPESRYEEIKRGMAAAGGPRTFERLHQSCAKKLLEGLLKYAKELGFSPHPDYKNAMDIFGNIDASVCPVKYTYGKDGKPFYMNGPYESTADVLKNIETLRKKCGADGFNMLYRLGDEDFDDDVI